MMRSFLAVLLTSQLVHAAAFAADAPVSAIRAGRLIDVVAGKVLTDQVVIIRGDRIESVGAAGTASIPAGARMIDLSAHTVLPGLIDTHTHVTSDPALPPYHEYGLSVPRIALKGAANAKATLLGGVTTV